MCFPTLKKVLNISQCKCITLVRISGPNEQLYLNLKDRSSQAQSLKQGENSTFLLFMGFIQDFVEYSSGQTQ